MDSINETIKSMLLTIPALLIGLTFHEYAHAVTADRLGDKTPKYQGRLTLNPLVHIDIIGFILFIIIGFGWAKPVQINPNNFKNYRKDDLKVSAAGPVANLVIAFAFALILTLFISIIPTNVSGYYSSQLIYFIYIVIEKTVYLNCVLFILNLLPIPGFDGYHILSDIFPKIRLFNGNTLYIIQIIFILVIMGSLGSYIIGLPAAKICGLFYNFWSIIIKSIFQVI